MIHRILWALLALAPVTILIDYLTHADKVVLFLLSCAALIPLAWLIGEATEHAAEHTGPGIGGFLNASFGNAPELIIALFAVAGNLPAVVRGSLTGSVVYAVEIFDAPTSRLLGAFVTKQYPPPYDIKASVGPLAAAEAGMDKGAEALIAQLR